MHSEETINAIDRTKIAFNDQAQRVVFEKQAAIKIRENLEAEISANQAVIETSSFWQWRKLKTALQQRKLYRDYLNVHARLDHEFQKLKIIYYRMGNNLISYAAENGVESGGEVAALSAEIASYQSWVNSYSHNYSAYKELNELIQVTISYIDATVQNISEAEALKLTEVMSTPSHNRDGSVDKPGFINQASRFAGTFAQDYGTAVTYVRGQAELVYYMAEKLQEPTNPVHFGKAGSGAFETHIIAQFLKPGALKNLAQFVNLTIADDAKMLLSQLRGALNQLLAQTSVPVKNYDDFEALRKAYIASPQRKLNALRNEIWQTLAHEEGGASGLPSLDRIFLNALADLEGYKSSEYQQASRKLSERFNIVVAGVVTLALGTGVGVYEASSYLLSPHAQTQAVPSPAPSTE